MTHHQYLQTPGSGLSSPLTDNSGPGSQVWSERSDCGLCPVTSEESELWGA